MLSITSAIFSLAQSHPWYSTGREDTGCGSQEMGIFGSHHECLPPWAPHAGREEELGTFYEA